MKLNKSVIWSLVLLIVVAAVYRVIPNRPYGFAPQIAMAVFAGMVIKDKKWMFAVPVFSMFISDLLYQTLYLQGFTPISGFYEYQWAYYLIFIGITALASVFAKINFRNFIINSLLAPVAYFIASNFVVWITGFGLYRPRTFAGLMQCYVDALPFFRPSVVATLAFGAVLFGGFYFLNQKSFKLRMANN